MSISRSKPRGRGLIALWHLFHIWRAKRKYARVEMLFAAATREITEADRLMRKHAEDPQSRLQLGDD